VREVKNGGRDIMVEHDAVPGFMGAMTMLFPARGPAGVLGALAPGDTIDATLVVEESRYWIEGIRRKPGSAAAVSSSPPVSGSAPESGAVTPVPNRSTAVGEMVPDFELTDQTGHALRLSSLRGEPVAVTFLYTRCPIATACPMTTAKFSRLDSLLAQRKFGKLLVVTVDPEHDTPKVLAEYASKAGADPKRWKFLTGDPHAVADVASAFGILYYPDHGQIVHGQGVAVVGPDGKLASIYYGQSWEPEHILRDLEKARKG
jgi:protein SCO1/2